MADIATLGLAVRPEGVDKANKSLKKFSTAAGQAERAAKGMGTGATSAANKAAAANDNVARSASKLGGVYRKVAGIITGVFASAIAAVGLRQFMRTAGRARTAGIRPEAAPAMPRLIRHALRLVLYWLARRG